MERINQITIINYRAFFNEQANENKYQINLPQGENLLVYGENGSGKSSFYKAMYDFFHSSKKEIIPQQNIFTENETDLPETSINVHFTNNTIFEFNRLNSTAYNHNFFKNSKGAFLTYRDILNTYFPNLNDENNNPDLFNLFINEILYCLTDNEDINTLLKELNDLEIQVNTFKKVFIRETKRKKDKDQIEEIFQNLKEGINTRKTELNLKLTFLLKELLKEVNNYLKKYFNFNFQVALKNSNRLIYTKISQKSQFISKSLYLKIKLFNSEIKEHTYQSFLNEARLSALALSVYLAALKIESRRLANQNHKFLFLDDIFIGLDTSNRIPLLEILKNDFNDFQIFITTYDRHWFDIAKDWFERKTPNRWKFYELYADDYSYSDKEIPKLLPFKNSLAQALYYYKQSDYSASGNYLRKACEETLRKILPSICFKSTDGLDMTKLSNMLERAIFFFNVLEKPIDELNSLSVYLQSLMNPLSHYDINISVYRKEIKDVEKAIKNLQLQDFSKTTFKQILDKNTMLKLTYRVNADTENVYEIEIKEELWIYKLENSSNICIGAVPCKNINLYEIKSDFGNQFFHYKIESPSIKQFYENVVEHENKRNPTANIPILPDYENQFEYSDGRGKWDSLISVIKF